MNIRKIVSIAVAAVGVILVILAVDAMVKIGHAQGVVDKMNTVFSQTPSTWNPLVKAFNGKAQMEISKYHLPVMICLVAGIVLAVGGGISTFRCMCCCKKKR